MKVFEVAVVVVGIGLSSIAQENNTFKVKHSPPDRTPRSTVAPMGKSATIGTSTAATSKDLQNLERQTAKSSTPSHGPKTKVPKTAAVQPIRDKSSPPIKVGGGAASNAGGLNHQSPNPYKGRLKQKYSRGQ